MSFMYAFYSNRDTRGQQCALMEASARAYSNSKADFH